MKFVIDKFEEELCSALNTNPVIATSSGWSALYASLLSLDLQKGDEVITTPFTFQATTNSIIAAGGTPVFVDINEDDHLINPDKIQEAITYKTKAILPVHLFGRACNMDKIVDIAHTHKLWVIEDAAQGFLAEYKGRKLGTIGHMGCYSFYLTKNLSTFEGGAIAIHPITKSKEKVIRSIISYGRNESGEFSRFGFNGRMSAQSALTGYAQLKMHKNQAVSSIGEYNEENGFYPYLTYEHEFIKKLGIHGDCPVAEKVSKWIKEKRKSY